MTPAERDGPHWRAWRALRREERRRFGLRFKKWDLQRGRDVHWLLLGTRWEWAAWAREAEVGRLRQVDAALASGAIEPVCHGRRVRPLPTLDDYDRWRGDHARRCAPRTLEDVEPLHGPLRWGRL